MSPDAETTEAPAEAEAETDAPPTDDVRAGMLAALEESLGDAVVASHIVPGVGLWVRVKPEAWIAAGEAVRDQLNCKFFDFLSAIDWLPNPFGRYEDADVDDERTLADKVADARGAERVTGYAGGDTRFQVFARVADVVNHRAIVLKVDLPDDALTLPTWIPIYAGANWHERETWEMFGITFEGHPDVRHIYLPGDFEGNPLRKDFPLLARVVKPWPGIVDVEPMPGEPAGEEDAEAAEGGDGE